MPILCLITQFGCRCGLVISDWFLECPGNLEIGSVSYMVLYVQVMAWLLCLKKKECHLRVLTIYYLIVHFNKVLHITGVRTLFSSGNSPGSVSSDHSCIDIFIAIFCFICRPQLLKNALQRAVERGQLEQITGKGASGTFQVRGQKGLVI